MARHAAVDDLVGLFEIDLEQTLLLDLLHTPQDLAFDLFRMPFQKCYFFVALVSLSFFALFPLLS